MTSVATDAAVAASTPYDPELHPHVKSGSTGGQFAPKGTSQSQPAPAKKSAPAPVKKAATPAAKPAAKKAAPQKKPARKPVAKPAAKAKPAHHGRYAPMRQGGTHNDPARVKELQALLGELGLGKVGVDGKYGPQTEAAVMAAQRKLGLKPTGRAGSGLMRRLHDAHALSPCVPKSGSKVSAAAAYTVDDEDAVLVDELPGDEYDVQVWSDGTAWLTEDGETGLIEVGQEVLASLAQVVAGHPHPGQKYTHGWIPVGEVIDQLKAAGGHDDGAMDLGAGDYLNWSIKHEQSGDEFRTFEAGDGESVTQIEMNSFERRSLFHALTLTVMADEGDAQSHHTSAMLHAGHEHMQFADGGSIDWSVKHDDDSRSVEFGDDNDSVVFNMSPDDMREWQASLGITQLQDNSPNAVKAALGHDVTPGHDELHHWWTRGGGLKLWADSPTPWTTLVALLSKIPEVGPIKAKVFASKWHKEVFGIWVGEKKGKNPIGPG